MTPEEIKKQKDELLAEIKQASTDSANEAVKSQLTEIEQKVDKAVTAEQLEEIKKSLKDDISKLQAKMKEVQNTSVNEQRVEASDKMLSMAIKSAIGDNKESLKSYKGGTVHLDTQKAITTASFGDGGFASLTGSNLGLYRNPYAPVYLRNIFPNISIDGSNLNIWKQSTVTGAGAIWKRGTGTAGADEAKPEISPTWVKENVEVDWIAGTTNIQREVLDDVQFMSTEIPYVLIYGPQGILAAENKMILDYIDDNAVDFTAVGGDFGNSLESVIAAAYGQLGDNYMAPTHIIINNWDYLRYLAFNKAGGSGEYDYPSSDLKLINGNLFINNLQAVPNPSVTQGTAYVVAADHSRYVSRQGLQMRVAEEHGDNFVKNMVTYRAEIRAGFFTYNDNSLVKVTLPTPAVEEVPAG